jgi:hypothetical protein
MELRFFPPRKYHHPLCSKSEMGARSKACLTMSTRIDSIPAMGNAGKYKSTQELKEIAEMKEEEERQR